MDALIKFVSDCIKVPIKNWYRALSERTRFIVNQIIVILFAFGLFLFAASYIFNSSLNNFDEAKHEQHEAGTEKRIDCQASIYNNLQNLQIQTNAKRACIVEMHNGVNNPTGLPYLYGEMTYEQPAEGVPFIGDAFQKVTLSTYKMGMFIHNHFEWFGSVEQLKSMDGKMYNYIKTTDVKYIGVIALHNKKCEIGFLILTFNNEKISEDEQHKILIWMAQYSNYIVSDLTMVEK